MKIGKVQLWLLLVLQLFVVVDLICAMKTLKSFHTLRMDLDLLKKVLFVLDLFTHSVDFLFLFLILK